MKSFISLIGMPRSGTTWIAKAIDSHPDVHYLHEPDTVKKIKASICLTKCSDRFEKEAILFFLKGLEYEKHSRCVGKLPFYNKSYNKSYEQQLNKFFIYLQKIAERAGLSTFKEKVPVLGQLDKSKLFWKSIESMGRVGALSECAPDSKFVILTRHPCAILASVKRGLAKNKYSSSIPVYENWGVFEKLIQGNYARGHDITIDKLKIMSVATRMAWRWLMFIEDTVRQAQKSDNCMVVKYENVCAEPSKYFAEILNFYGLSFDKQVHDYIIETTSSSDEDFYSINKNPLESSQKWKNELDKSEIVDILSVLEGTSTGKNYL